MTVLYSRAETQGTPRPTDGDGAGAGAGEGGGDDLAEELRRQLAQSARKVTRQASSATPAKFGSERDLLGRRQLDGGGPPLARPDSATPGAKAAPQSLTDALSKQAELQRSITRAASRSLGEATESAEV